MSLAEPGHADSITPAPRTPSLADGVSFRLANARDAPAVAELIGRVWSHFFGYSVTPDDLKEYLATSLSPAQIERDITNDIMTFLVATLDSPVSDTDPVVIGVAQLVAGPSEPCLTLPVPIELRRIYVSEEHHGRGVAEGLVKRVEDLARDHCGGQSLWLGVWENNPKAQRFYSKMGFKTVGEHSFVVGESIRRDWVMEKAL